jgi:ubiquinone/menaquinone biosynthesis C-methylase UbiE
MLYGSLAPYYDLVYSGKDYRAESRRIQRWVRQFGTSGGRALLDLACGTGNHLRFLSRKFECVGLDTSQSMLRVARKKLPEVRLVRGSIEDFRLDKKFDAITCLFSAIGYVEDVPALNRAVQNIASHLFPGGVAIVEPWLTPREYRVGSVHLLTYSSPTIKIARADVAQRRGRKSILRMHYLIARRGGPVIHRVDDHRLTLFTKSEMRQAFHRAGLEVRYFRKGISRGRRGAYVAIRAR